MENNEIINTKTQLKRGPKTSEEIESLIESRNIENAAEEISLKNALLTKKVKEASRKKQVMLSLRESTYIEVLKMLKENKLSFNSFIDNLCTLICDDRITVKIRDLSDIGK